MQPEPVETDPPFEAPARWIMHGQVGGSVQGGDQPTFDRTDLEIRLALGQPTTQDAAPDIGAGDPGNCPEFNADADTLVPVFISMRSTESRDVGKFSVEFEVGSVFVADPTPDEDYRIVQGSWLINNVCRRLYHETLPHGMRFTANFDGFADGEADTGWLVLHGHQTDGYPLSNVILGVSSSQDGLNISRVGGDLHQQAEGSSGGYWYLPLDGQTRWDGCEHCK